jgi:hypothetical protein
MRIKAVTDSNNLNYIRCRSRFLRKRNTALTPAQKKIYARSIASWLTKPIRRYRDRVQDEFR